MFAAEGRFRGTAVGMSGRSIAVSSNDFRSLDFDRLWAGRETTTSVEGGILAELLRATDGSRILEMGTGTGRLTPVLRHAAREYVGLDLHAEFLDRLPSSPGPERSLSVAADALHAPFVDGSFTTIVIVRVYNFFQDPRPLLQEVARLLTPDGCVIIGYQPRPSFATLVDDYRMFLRGERAPDAPTLTFSGKEQVPVRPGQFLAWLPTRGGFRSTLDRAGFSLEESLSSGLEDYWVARRVPARVFLRLAGAADRFGGLPNQFVRARKRSTRESRMLASWETMLGCPNCHRGLGAWVGTSSRQEIECSDCGRKVLVREEWVDATLHPTASVATGATDRLSQSGP